MCMRWGYTLSGALEEDLGLVLNTVETLVAAGHPLGALPVILQLKDSTSHEDDDGG